MGVSSRSSSETYDAVLPGVGSPVPVVLSRRSPPQLLPAVTARHASTRRGRCRSRRDQAALMRPWDARRQATTLSRACAAGREGGARNESGSSAKARQTNAVSLHRPRHHLPTPRSCPACSVRHSMASTGVYQHYRVHRCAAEVRGSTPLRSTSDLQGKRVLRALPKTLEAALCNHQVLLDPGPSIWAAAAGARRDPTGLLPGRAGIAKGYETPERRCFTREAVIRRTYRCGHRSPAGATGETGPRAGLRALRDRPPRKSRSVRSPRGEG
jgi:hypothetical protein